MERVILGTAALGGIWGTVKEEAAVETMLAALELGIGAIDTAPAYGDAELYIGKALRQWKGKPPVISTKVGRLRGLSIDQGAYDYTAYGMHRSLEQSLVRTGVNKMGVVFLHDPEQLRENQVENVLKALVSFKEKGYTDKIGLGGNAPAWFDRYIHSGVFDVVMEFNKLNACNASALTEHLPFCNEYQIDYYAASLLNMGLLGNCYDAYTTNPPAWLDYSFVEAAKKIKVIADAHSIPLASLAHRFVISLPQQFKLVIGPRDLVQLLTTLNDFAAGPLDESLVHEIYKYTVGNFYLNEQNRK
ncbi:hypothetical protein A3860_23625 [Niastella vici]|uniref:NADP-dependent oxidoreductase domain-containing protein n=1 Tax=Niastella vici TaxID=1703345 RepID=A0A1V9FZX6_9BACT|nr:aldo/keto reductase [Niastella vici]OQP63921.1 hypothetical protein A3860_23625 [Niastella vici]